MSVTVAAIAKKVAVYLATDKRTWKASGMIIGIAIAIVLLPAMLLLAMGNQFSGADVQEVDYSQFVQSLSAQQQTQLSQMESDGKAIETELTDLGMKNQIVKAQMIYLTYFDSVQKGENFFAEYADCFKESDDEKLIESLNQKYGLSIDYEEFMRTYTVISNVSIDENRFLNLSVKNNIDLARWAENAYETRWGYVPHSDGNVLTELLLQDRASVFGGQVTSYMDFIRSNWMGKRTADCVGLIKGYGWYDSVSGEIVVGSNGMMGVTANGMFDAATVKGTIDTIPEVPGLAVWHQGHFGIYIGNGEVIEAMNTTRGVTRTKLAGRSWTHWLQIPYISYVENMEEKQDESTLEK